MATTFSILGKGPSGFRAAPAETNLLTYWNAGATGSWTLSGTTLTGSQSDADGGTDAVLLDTTNLGTVGSANAVTASATLALYSGIVHVRFRCKKIGGNTAWVRFQFGSISVSTTNNQFWVNPGTGAVGSYGAAHTTAPTMTADVGSDGYVVNAYINITGADVSGSLNFALCSADSATTISRNANEGVRLHDLTVGY